MKKAKTREKIDIQVKDGLDNLEDLLKSEQHLNDPLSVIAAIEKVATFYTFLSWDEREYIQFARQAIEDQIPWNQPK